MNFQPVKTIFVIIVAFLLFCHRIVQSDPILGTKNVTGTNTRIMKAFLMHCSENLTNHNNIQVTVQIAVHSPSKTRNNSFVGKILLGNVFDSNPNLACDLKAPSLVDVSSEEFALMYPFKLEATMQSTTEIPTPANNKEAKINNNLNHIDRDKDVHSANNVKFLDDIYYSRLKSSDFLKRNDFMHTNPKDFRRDSICAKNFRKDNNKNNANNEYANEEFYGDKNQRENENAFSGKLGMNFNNNEIDNIKSNKRNDNENNNNMNDIGYFTKNFFDDEESWKRRKKIKEYKNDFIKCVGMKIFKKIDHVLCTCARNVDVDETQNNDEQSDCFQLINIVCLWGPVYNKNINYKMKMNEDIRNVNYGNIKLTAFACCDLLPPFYSALGNRCYDDIIKDDVYDEVDNKWIGITESKLLDELPEIMKKESDEVLDDSISYLRSKIAENEEIDRNKIHESDAIISPKYHIYSGSPMIYKNKEFTNGLNKGRLINIEIDDVANGIVKISDRPSRQRVFHKKEAKPFDRDIYDPHLNLADKMQLINMINPKRPCERNKINNRLSFLKRQIRSSDMTDQSSLTDKEIDSALENYDNSDSKNILKSSEISSISDSNKCSKNQNTSMNPKESVKNVQKTCSQHPCALAMPFKKDPYLRGEIQFLESNGLKLNSNQIAENICHDHFHEYILIPFDYASEGT